MRRHNWWISLLTVLLLSSASSAQVDPEGRQFAWKLWEAYQQSQGGPAFQSLFQQNPQMTKRAFVSTVEYATEIFQQDMQGAQQALNFASGLAQGIGQVFGDQVPSTLMERMLRQDYSVLPEFARYASALHPGYAQAMQQSGPAGYPQQNPAYGPTGYPQQGPAGYPQQNPAYGPTGYPQQGPAGYPPQNPAYGPTGYPQQGPAGYPQSPGYPPTNSDPLRPSGATGGPQG